jgi:cell division GTPase FtsZ
MGSGSIPVISQAIRERHRDKPIYNLIVLPFEHEERNEERAIYNSATCMKLARGVTDAIFLVDNQRYVRKDASLRTNLDNINERIVKPFYDILCSGEERNIKYIGTKILNVGDIILTLAGWTVIGYGSAPLRGGNLPLGLSRYFGRKERDPGTGIKALEAAVEELSFTCNPEEANRALYILTGPSKEMNLTVIEKLVDHLKSLAPDAAIRSGDYPRGTSDLDISLILSELTDVEKVKRYYTEAARVAPTVQRMNTERRADNPQDL